MSPRWGVSGGGVPKGNPWGTYKGLSREFTGECFTRGKGGHRAADCPNGKGGGGFAAKGGIVGGVDPNKKVFAPIKLPAGIRPRFANSA